MTFEPLWQKVMDSFSWDPGQAVVLKFDGDERAFREPYAKKKKKPRKAAKSTILLPPHLAYLQPVLDAFLSVPREELGESTDTTLLEEALRQRLEGLDLAEAEDRVQADKEALQEWLSGPGKKAPAGHIIVAWLNPFIAAEILEGGLHDSDE